MHKEKNGSILTLGGQPSRVNDKKHPAITRIKIVKSSFVVIGIIDANLPQFFNRLVRLVEL